MQDKLEFKQIREFGEIINDLFLFIRQNLKPLLKVYLYLGGIFLLGAMVAAIIQQVGMRSIMLDGMNGNSSMIFSKYANLFTPSYFLVIIFLMLNYTAMNVSILSYIAVYIEKGNVPPTVEEVWGYFKYYFLRAFGSSFIIFLFAGVCFLLCVVPGIYVFPAVSLFFAVMVFENGTFGYAFGRSFRILKDQWWATAAVLIIIWIITYAATLFASLPAIIITMVGVFTQGAKGLSTTMIILSTVIQYLCQVFMIIPIIGSALCYFNLVERQESAGLLNRINQMGDKRDGFDTPEDY